MKKIVAIILSMVMLFGFGSFVASAAEEEERPCYEKALIEEGFEQDPSDDSLWTYDGVYDDRYRIKAYYDAYYDNGSAYMYDFETMETTIFSFKWSPLYEEFEEITSYTFE